jgi:ferredoxin-NADP reductase
MLKYLDNFIDRITMYRLVLYYLLGLCAVALIFSAFGLLQFSPLALLASIVLMMAVAWLSNVIFAKVFEAPTNVESIYITVLILALIISPSTAVTFPSFFLLASWAAILAMASKYILAIGKKHLFNPVAISVALLALFLNQSATWWVGTAIMMPFVLIGGLIVVRKLRRFDLVLAFLVSAMVTILAFSLAKGSNLWSTFSLTMLNVPILFFAFVMLTEPLTTPPTRLGRVAYGALVGFLFAPAIHIGTFYSTPELALVVGNIFSYVISPKTKLILKLKEKITAADGVTDFVFSADRDFPFRPGQYLEWTLAHEAPDSRGNRRYFTIASAPSEDAVRLGVKFYDQPSSFKKRLASLSIGETIVASQLAGEFVLPADRTQKLVFIAGGIGVTPFRSMIAQMLKRQDRRDVVLFYSNKTEGEIAYRSLFDQAALELGLKVVYTLSELAQIAPTWTGVRGMIDATLIAKQVPDFQDRIFYLSGPHGMVTAFENTLRKMGVPRRQIKTDFFPGLA